MTGVIEGILIGEKEGTGIDVNVEAFEVVEASEGSEAREESEEREEREGDGCAEF